MRQIKFKFWVTYPDKEPRMIEPTEYADLLIKGDGRLFCWSDIAENSGLVEENRDYFTALQYIGLKDKNDKEIYAGDIVKMHTRTGFGSLQRDMGKVIFAANSAKFTILNLKNDTRYIDLDEDMVKHIEVVGNAYENPDLLPPSEESNQTEK